MKSTLISYLFFGPLVCMSIAYCIWTLGGWGYFKWIAIGCLGWVILFALVAFCANLIATRKSANEQQFENQASSDSKTRHAR